MKPLGTYYTRENVISANKSAFEPTNSTSRTSAKKFNSVNPKVAAPKNKSTAETIPIWGFTPCKLTLKLSTNMTVSTLSFYH